MSGCSLFDGKLKVAAAAEDAELPFCWPRLPATTESLTISKLSLPLTFLPLAVKEKRRGKITNKISVILIKM